MAGEDRTEAPTPKRLTEAARRGERPDTREAGVALVTVVGALWLMFGGRPLVTALGEMTAQGLRFEAADLAHFDPASLVFRLVPPLAGPLAAVFSLTIAAAVLAALMGGGGISPGKLGPNFSRLDPIAGLGRMVGVEGLTELGRSALKLVLCAGVAYTALRPLVGDSLALAAADPGAAAVLVGDRAARLFLMLAGALVVIAVVSMPLAILRFVSRLRMTTEEVKQEQKEQEAPPAQRAALRRRAREAARQGIAPAVASAAVVITNPAHFAVALRYNRERDRAPVVVARGKGELAAIIRAAAIEHDTPILEHPDLARALYFTSRRESEIAVELYVAVAAVLAFVFGIARTRRTPPRIEVPSHLIFDENGQSRR